MPTLWTHNICAACWNLAQPGREPTTLLGPEREMCCFCQRINTDGIYMRQDPQLVACKGRTQFHVGAL